MTEPPHPSPPVTPDRSGSRTIALPAERLLLRDLVLILLGIVPLLIGLDVVPVWKSEGRWLTIASNMQRSGKWLEPELSGGFYGDKPLLSYWAILLAGYPLGRMDEEVARLPSALSGAFVVLVTGWMAARLLGRAQAVAAAWVLATAYSFVFWSRCASADLLSLAFGTGAIAVYLESVIRFQPWQPFAFFILLALGGQSKGMPSVIPPLAVAAVHEIIAPAFRGSIGSGGWRGFAGGLLGAVTNRDLFRKLAWAVPAAALGGALYFAPFYLSYLDRGDWQLLSLMWKENFVRAFDAFDHTAPPWYYVYTLPLMFLPWSLWLPGAVAWGVRQARQNAGLFFALAAFVTIFGLFSASESRRSYYILPVFSFAAILVAGLWAGVAERLERGETLARVWRLLAILPRDIFQWAIAAVVILLAIGWILPGAPREAWNAIPYPFLHLDYIRIICTALHEAWNAIPYPFLLGVQAATGFALVALARRKVSSPRASFLAAAAAAILLFAYYSVGIEKLRAQGLVERTFAREVKSRIDGSSFVYFRADLSVLRYYLGSAETVKEPGEILKLLESGKSEVLIVSEAEDLEKLAQLPSLSVEPIVRTASPAIGGLVPARDRFYLVRCTRRAHFQNH